MGYKDPEQQKEYQRKWIAARRAAFFADKCCVDCGSTADLELDHLDPSEKITHRIWSWSVARRNTELAKCEIRCTECHLIKTIANNDIGVIHMYKHGTISMYEQHGCRCDPCKAIKKVYNAKRYTKSAVLA